LTVGAAERMITEGYIQVRRSDRPAKGALH
jgi:hypothetical protein